MIISFAAPSPLADKYHYSILRSLPLTSSSPSISTWVILELFFLSSLSFQQNSSILSMSTDSRTGTSSTIVTPSHKALRRLGRLGDESALDSECHLWELWIKILKTDPDTDHIRCPQCSPDHLDSECIWVDAAWGFRVQRIHLAKKILEVLKDITYVSHSTARLN